MNYFIYPSFHSNHLAIQLLCEEVFLGKRFIIARQSIEGLFATFSGLFKNMNEERRMRERDLETGRIGEKERET